MMKTDHALYDLWGLSDISFRTMLESKWSSGALRSASPAVSRSAAAEQAGATSEPVQVASYSIDIEAPVGTVWDWLTQMMRGGGMYGWSRLETGHIHSADFLIAHDDPHRGDRVGDLLEIASVSPMREIVWQSVAPFQVLDTVVDGLYLRYTLEPRGDHRSRLSAEVTVTFERSSRPIQSHAFQSLCFILPECQLVALKRLAEHTPYSIGPRRRQKVFQVAPFIPAGSAAAL